MNVGLNAGIKALEAVKDIVSEKTKGRWSSWFKVGESRKLIDKICSVALTDMYVDQQTTPVAQAIQPFIDEKGRSWLPFSFEWRNEIDDQTFSTTLWAIDAAHAQDQLDHIKLNGRIRGEVIGVIKA